MQPYIPDRKSVTALNDAQDVTGAKASKYCLITQEADTEGELETKLFKGDIIPTTGGGAQVILNDVELLKQYSPTRSPPGGGGRKRTSSNQQQHWQNGASVVASAPPMSEVQGTRDSGNKKAKY